MKKLLLIALSMVVTAPAFAQNNVRCEKKGSSVVIIDGSVATVVTAKGNSSASLLLSSRKQAKNGDRKTVSTYIQFEEQGGSVRPVVNGLTMVLESGGLAGLVQSVKIFQGGMGGPVQTEEYQTADCQ